MLALAVEAVEQGTRDLKQSNSPPLTDPLSPNPCHYTEAGTKTGIAKGRPSGDGKMSCYRCGGSNHLAPTCRFKEAVCRFCNKKGHLARVCRAKGRSDSRNDEPPKTHLYVSEDPLTTTLDKRGTRVDGDRYWSGCFGDQSFNLPGRQSAGLSSQAAELGHSVEDLHRRVHCSSVKYREKETGQLIQVVDGEGPNLMGRDLLTSLEVTWEGRIAHISEHSQALKEVLDKHASVSTMELGCLQGQEVHLHVNTTVAPKFCKPHTVTFALRDKVEAELDRLGSLGIISPEKSATWAAPIVPVVKKNGTVCNWGDYKATINQATKETYPAGSLKVEDQQSRQKNCHDSSSSSTRLFAVNDLVFAKNFSGRPPNWVPGRVVRVTGPLSYEIELLQGGTIRRHVDAVRRRESAVTPEPAVTPETDDGEMNWVPDDILLSSPTPSSEGPPPTDPTTLPARRSTRTTRPLDRFSQ